MDFVLQKQFKHFIFMTAGLLADIILGESPYLKELARHFNLIVLDSNGRITGFNNLFLNNVQKREDQILNKSFTKFFDSDEGKSDLSISLKNASKGQPCAIQFNFFESKVTFSGVVLPIYDFGQNPSNLVIIAKEEHKNTVEEFEIEDFWSKATKMMEEAGISSSNQEDLHKSKLRIPKILLVEDQNGMIVKVFQKFKISRKEEILIAPSAEAALSMSLEFQPNVVITHYNPIGNLSVKDFSGQMKQQFNTETIFLSHTGNELRIEDGWLDIHIKDHPDSVNKVLDLINQFYW